jgi:hypothetical protein
MSDDPFGDGLTVTRGGLIRDDHISEDLVRDNIVSDSSVSVMSDQFP